MSKLLDDVRDVMRVRHYSYQTEQNLLLKGFFNTFDS